MVSRDNSASGERAAFAATLELPLLGVPMRYRSNSVAVIALAEQVLGHWRTLPAQLVASGPALEVVIDVQQPLAAAAVGPAIVRVSGDTILFAFGDGLMSASLARGEALACVSSELLVEQPALCGDVLERLGLLLVSVRDRMPLAAAGLVRNNRAVLLLGAEIGPQLLEACLQGGFTLLAPHRIHMSLEPEPRLWGKGSAVAALPLVVSARRAIVCLVEHGAGQASRIEPLPSAEAAAAIRRPPEIEFAPLERQLPAVAAALTAGGAYRLIIGADPRGASLLLTHLAET